MRTKLTAFVASLIFCLLPFSSSRSSANATHPANTVYLFVEVETKVYR